MASKRRATRQGAGTKKRPPALRGTMRRVRITLDICVFKGRLCSGAGVPVPIDLLAALNEQARKCTVEELPGFGVEVQVQQSVLFYRQLRAIWDATDRLVRSGWALATTYEPTQGSRPPWKRGSGALCALGRVDPARPRSKPAFVLNFGNEAKHEVLQEAVDVQFLVGITFV